MGKSQPARLREAGSLHAVIIAVLFLALMATLGVVFYQNFIAQKPAAVQPDKTEDVKPLIARMGFASDIYALDYPKEWKSITTKAEPGATGQSETKLTSPDSKVQVTLTVTEGGIGGTCDINDGLKISDYRVNEVPVANLAPAPVYLVEGIVDSLGGGYAYSIGLTPDSGATHAAIGESHCNLGYVGVASSLVIEGGKVVQPMIVAKITFPKLQPKTDVAIKDMRQIKDLMDTDDYKDAVKILESARKE